MDSCLYTGAVKSYQHLTGETVYIGIRLNNKKIKHNGKEEGKFLLVCWFLEA